MEKSRRTAIVMLVAGLFLLGLYFGIRLPRWVPKGPARLYDTPVLLQRIQTLSELVTVKYTMEQVEVWTDPPPAVVAMYAGDNGNLLLGQGTMKAGIDLSQIKPDDIQIDGKTVRVKLPPAQIT